ncbi:MAG TPA: cytochrome c oxidase subunit II, partial [Bryobacteraceae bacterium]
MASVTILCSCAGHQQSAIDPAGPESGKIAALWWGFFWLLAVIFAIVMAVMLVTLLRRPPPAVENRPPAHAESRLTRTVAAATVVTVLLLFVLLIVSVETGKATADLGKKPNLLTIEVTGNQWWWQFRYMNPDPSRILTTANEIHVPVGQPVLIQGRSNDVLHSFWVPNLQGKRDLIPSRVTTEYFQADNPGVYRGQCSEFCGLQHAHMAFYVIAEPKDKFNAWMQAQLQPAASPSDPVLQHGEQVFLNYQCVYCHQIRGTTAAGQNGPDLTHFGSRRSLAAGVLPNTIGNLGGWIVNPQRIKPGTHMATIAVAADDLQPLL